MAVMIEAVGSALDDVAARFGRPVAIGHSMGAGALLLAALAGAPVRRVVLEDPRIAHERTRTRVRLGRMRARAVQQWQDDPELARQDLERSLPGWSATELDAAAHARPLTDPALLRTGISGLEGDDDTSIECLARAPQTLPVLLVTGDRPGAVWTAPLRARLAAQAPRVQVAVAPGGEHCPRRRSGPAYHRVVDAFVEAT